ncbi:alpha/beta hydrolase-fold protein [Breoghania sp.]|uniref:alpha/beta hydrolase family esterase n=1 Tax=Breoghania sp. TaxID=2065378 RepID=UPI00262527F7|nr:alpha/beta hydrolase-fold protein [Breoghania sp.]
MIKARRPSAGTIAFLGRGFICGVAFTALLLGLSPAGTAETSLVPRPSTDDCGVAAPCHVPGGEYRVRMPQGWDGTSRVGAILYLHGYRGTAENAINNKGLIRTASDLSLALITLQGAERSWSFPGNPRQRRDNIAFIRTVLDDAVAHHAVDPDKVMASGFFVGGSMVWYLACYLGDRFADFAPVAGAFWEPQPTGCPGPESDLFHVHGTGDKVVPMAGRAIGDVAHQADVNEGMALWLAKGACTTEVPQEFKPDDTGLVCQRRTACAGRTIELCLHPGDHVFKPVWVKRAWLELADLRGWDVPTDAQ